MSNKICYVKITKDISKDEPGSPIPFRLTERIVDRDSEVIEPKGLQMKDYKKNPVVLWSHNRTMGERRPAIGKILIGSVEQTNEYVDADVVFDVENDSFAAMIDGKIRDGFLNAGSIGFRALTVGREPVLPKQKGATILKSELFEFSIVNIPANIGASRRDWENFIDECNSFDCVAEKINKDDFFEEYKKYFDDTDGNADTTEDKTVVPYKKFPLADEAKLEIKVGAVLSTANRRIVQTALDSVSKLKTDLITVEKSLKDLLESTQKPPKEEANTSSYVDLTEIQAYLSHLEQDRITLVNLDYLRNSTETIKNMIKV